MSELDPKYVGMEMEVLELFTLATNQETQPRVLGLIQSQSAQALVCMERVVTTTSSLEIKVETMEQLVLAMTI